MSDFDSQAVNELNTGWARAMGLEIISVGPEEAVIEWTVRPDHLQPYGIVHGGVHCGVIETLCSIAGAARAASQGKGVVGVENHTSFVRAVRGGRLRAVARPLHVGQRAQLWQADITDEKHRIVATGRVRLFCIDPGERAAE